MLLALVEWLHTCLDPSFFFPGGVGWNFVATAIAIEPNINIHGRDRGAAVDRADFSAIGSRLPIHRIPTWMDRASAKMRPRIPSPKTGGRGLDARINPGHR